jgi:hypothetical protein
VDEATCGVRLAMKEVRDATARTDHTTLADINVHCQSRAPPAGARRASTGRPPKLPRA